LRNQRVDVGVDFKMTGCIETGRYRKNKRDRDNQKGKPRAGSDNRYDNTGQHSFSSCRYGLASNARFLPEFQEPIEYQFWVGFFRHADGRRKPAETAPEAHIVGIAGGKVTNGWGIKAFFTADLQIRYLITNIARRVGRSAAIRLFSLIFF
jgi:hypothetical protein